MEKNMYLKITVAVILSILIVSILLLILSNFMLKEEMKTQKWDSGDWTFIGEFEMEGRNATPVKEIVTDKYEFVEVRVDKYETQVPVYFFLEVYYFEDQEIPVTKLQLPATSGENIIVKCPIKKGYTFQILTQVFKENGEYDPDLPCTLGYSYRLTND